MAATIITPLVDGVTLTEVVLDACSGNTIIGARFSIGASGDVVAVNRLVAGAPDSVVLNPGDTEFYTVTNINVFRVDSVGIGSATNTSGKVVQSSDVYADFFAARILSDFSSLGAGYSRRFKVQLSPSYTNDRYATLRVSAQ